jgi:hypothetical protein
MIGPPGRVRTCARKFAGKSKGAAQITTRRHTAQSTHVECAAPWTGASPEALEKSDCAQARPRATEAGDLSAVGQANRPAAENRHEVECERTTHYSQMLSDPPKRRLTKFEENDQTLVR